MADRVIGQDTTIVLFQDNAPILAIDSIKSFEFTIMLEILKESYLGRTSDSRDEVFRGVGCKVEANISGIEIFQLQAAVVNRARNRTVGTRIDLKSTLQIPNGDRCVFVFPDVKFGDWPTNLPGRTEYAAVTLSMECETYRFITRN